VDTLAQAKQEAEKLYYSISFIKFSKLIVKLCTSSREELIALTVKKFFRTDWVEFLDAIHGECTPREDYRALVKLFKYRAAIDVLGPNSPKEKLSTLVELYPVFIFPVFLLQDLLKRHITKGAWRREQKKTKDEEAPSRPTLKSSWKQSTKVLFTRILNEHSENNARCTETDVAPKQRNIGFALETTKMEPYNQSKIKKSAQCYGCGKVAFLQNSSLCLVCEGVVFPALAQVGGFQFAACIMKRSSGFSECDLQPPAQDLWIEKVDQQLGKTFFFNITTGESVWTLPRNLNNAQVQRLTKKQIKDIKRKNRPEWLV